MATVHEVLGSKVQLYRRTNSPYWWCSATVSGARYRASTRKASLSEATAFAKDWALQLHGADRWGGGVKKQGKTFREAAERFLDQFELMTRGERSQKYVHHHRGRVRNHLNPFFGDMVLGDITAGTIDEYRLHRFKVGPLPRGPKKQGAAEIGRAHV